MYGIFEIAGRTKFRAFGGASFDTIDSALASVSSIVMFSDIDEDNDAADFITKTGAVYAVERAR